MEPVPNPVAMMKIIRIIRWGQHRLRPLREEHVVPLRFLLPSWRNNMAVSFSFIDISSNTLDDLSFDILTLYIKFLLYLIWQLTCQQMINWEEDSIIWLYTALRLYSIHIIYYVPIFVTFAEGYKCIFTITSLYIENVILCSNHFFVIDFFFLSMTVLFYWFFFHCLITLQYYSTIVTREIRKYSFNKLTFSYLFHY